DGPAGGRTAQPALIDPRGAVQQPGIEEGTPGAAVLPQDVVPAIAVEVAYSRHLPVEDGATRRARAEDRGAVQEPDEEGARGGVAEEDVGPAVAVEVAQAHDGRARGDDTRPGGTGAADRGAVQEPDEEFARGRVVPEEVRGAIGVEVPAALARGRTAAAHQ